MHESGHQSFGNLLKRYRLEAGLTQEELAERAGLSRDAISTLERGARNRPHRDTVHLLAEALQLSPSERTLFEKAALNGDGWLEAARRTSRRLPTGSFLGALPSRPLIARQDEMGRVEAILDVVTAGTGQLLLLAGERGIGKTRLAQEAMVLARDRGFLVGTGRCYHRERPEPFAPVLEALAALVAGAPAGREASHEERVQTLREYGRAAAEQGDGHARLFATVTGLILELATVAPTALMLDDLQWADDGTLRLLHHLAHATRGASVLLLGTLQDTHLHDEHPSLARMLQELTREGLVESLPVRRLSAEETAMLAATIMGQKMVAEDLAALIVRRTRGLPQLIDQMVRSFGGRLQLQDEIGAGAMGRVFRAFDTKTMQPVAAKLLLARGEIDPEALLRFQQEVAALATLHHPNIVQIYDSFIEEHAGCIIMELLDGQSLHTVLRDGPLPLPRAKHLAMQVAEGIAYAHAHGIVHRDLKPDNIMVLADDQVTVTDFGIARMARPDTTLATIASTGMRMGTPLYMAPEQIQGQKIDARSDIYSFGAVLYEMVTGRPPFEGADPLSIAIKHLQEQPQPPHELNPEVPHDWEAVILKALAKDPAHRFRTMVELEQALEGLPVEPAETESEPGTTWGKLARSRRVVLGAGMLIILLVVAALLLRGHSTGTGKPIAASSCVPAFVEVTGLGANFSDLAYAGFERAAAKLHTRKPLFYGVPQEGDYAAKLSLAASRHPCAVVTFGAQVQTNALTSVSQRYPRVHFMLIDAEAYDTEGFPVDLPNVEQMPMATEQSGYLVGYLAGLMEKDRVGRATHGVIGAQGGPRWPQVTSYIDGYKQGAKAAYPRIKVLVDYTNSISNEAAAFAVGMSQIGRGADILFNVGSFAGTAYMRAGLDRGRYAIGVDVDQSSLGEYVLTSGLKNLDNAVYNALMDAAKKRFRNGVHPVGLAQHGTGLARPSSLVPPSIVAQVNTQARKIAAGEITVTP